MQKIPSGIEGFDKIAKGGVPRKKITVVMGPPKSGKTTFSAQFLVGGILISREPGVFVTIDEPPEKIIKKMKELGWDILEYINKGLWEFIDASPHLEQNFEISGNYDLGGLLIQIKMAIQKIKAKRIVLDSLSVLFNRFPDIGIIERDIFRLKSWLRPYSVTSIITNETNNEILEKLYCKISNYAYDNVIKLKNPLNGEHRSIEIIKYQGNKYLKGKHLFTIENKRGIVIIPND